MGLQELLIRRVLITTSDLWDAKTASISSHHTETMQPMQTSRFLQAPPRFLANETVSITPSKSDKIRTKQSASRWGLGAETSISSSPLCASVHCLKKHGTPGKEELQMLRSQQWQTQFEFWLYCTIISLGKGTIKWKMVINWYTHSISANRKCSFLALGRDSSLLVPGHFSALLITCVCSNGKHAYCNCFASCLHTFSHPDSSTACRKPSTGKLHHAFCRGARRHLASSSNTIPQRIDTAFCACRYSRSASPPVAD